MNAQEAMAEIWGALCPDCAPDNYAAIVDEVVERNEKLKELQAKTA